MEINFNLVILTHFEFEYLFYYQKYVKLYFMKKHFSFIYIHIHIHITKCYLEFFSQDIISGHMPSISLLSIVLIINYVLSITN